MYSISLWVDVCYVFIKQHNQFCCWYDICSILIHRCSTRLLSRATFSFFFKFFCKWKIHFCSLCCFISFSCDDRVIIEQKRKGKSTLLLLSLEGKKGTFLVECSSNFRHRVHPGSVCFRIQSATSISSLDPSSPHSPSTWIMEKTFERLFHFSVPLHSESSYYLARLVSSFVCTKLFFSFINHSDTASRIGSITSLRERRDESAESGWRVIVY